MIHLYFNAPWSKILKQKQSLCKILNPVVKAVEDRNGVCLACHLLQRDGLTIWRIPEKKKEKKKKSQNSICVCCWKYLQRDYAADNLCEFCAGHGSDPCPYKTT